MIYITGIIGNNKENNQVGLVDVIAMVKSDTEPILEVVINSPGGDSDTGFSIYKFLKNYKERQIYTYSQKQCNSIASVIFCAGEKRFAGCDMTIHNPAFHNPQGIIESEELIYMAEILEKTKKEASSIYKETTNIDDETLYSLMNIETTITPEEAVKFGFATDLDQKLTPILLYENPKNEKMKDEIKEIKETQNKILMFLENIGLKKKRNPKMLILIAADGTEVEIDKDVGEPQIGDIASPIGEWLMPNGETIVIEDVDGVIQITKIIPAGNDSDTEEMKTLKLQNAQLKTEIEKIKSERQTAATLLIESEKSMETILTDYQRLKNKEKSVSMYTPEERHKQKINSINKTKL